MSPESGVATHPLRQRLMFYGFAIVELAPWSVLNPQAWQVPNLEAVPCRSRAWRFALRACRKFSPHSAAPVIAPTWRQLRSIRGNQPERWLILCRPPFSGSPPAGLVRSLARPNCELPWYFHAESPDRRLRWLDTWPEALGDFFPPANQFPHHPWKQCLRLLQLRSPESRFWPREDGRIVQQMNLFTPWPAPTEEPSTLEDRQTFDRVLRQVLPSYRGHQVVCAKAPGKLAWFARDVLRTSGPSISSVRAPDWPDSRDPRTLFILVTDGWLRMHPLPRSWPLLHLDGSAYRHRFRAARLPGGTDVHWRSNEPCEAWARFRYRHRILTFIQRQGHWLCWSGENLDTPNRTDELMQRLATLDVLRSGRGIPFQSVEFAGA